MQVILSTDVWNFSESLIAL